MADIWKIVNKIQTLVKLLPMLSKTHLRQLLWMQKKLVSWHCIIYNTLMLTTESNLYHTNYVSLTTSINYTGNIKILLSCISFFYLKNTIFNYYPKIRINKSYLYMHYYNVLKSNNTVIPTCLLYVSLILLSELYQ